MSHYFIDTSALIKRYVVEVGTAWVQSIVVPNAGNTVFIAQLTKAEVVSGAARRKRDGTTSARSAHAVRLLIDRHANRDYKIIRLTDEIVDRAEDLLELYPLRAYDSVQLASALLTNMRLVNAGLAALTFVSADTKLLSAMGEGLIIEDPNAHP